jgi:hypothetical protein
MSVNASMNNCLTEGEALRKDGWFRGWFLKIGFFAPQILHHYTTEDDNC